MTRDRSFYYVVDHGTELAGLVNSHGAKGCCLWDNTLFLTAYNGEAHRLKENIYRDPLKMSYPLFGCKLLILAETFQLCPGPMILLDYVLHHLRQLITKLARILPQRIRLGRLYAMGLQTWHRIYVRL